MKTKAPRPKRLLAFALDVLLFSAPLLTITVVAPSLAVSGFEAGSPPLAQAYGVVVTGFLVLAAGVGRSFGMGVVGLELHRKNGRPCSWPRAAIRQLVAVMGAVPFLADWILGTQVASATSRGPRWVPLGGGGLLILGVAVALSGLPGELDPEALAFLRGHAIPTQATGGRDFKALGGRIGNARVVAMGEATHGDLESTQFKREFVQYLIEHKGFTLLALEAPASGAAAVDDYVRGGKGDARSAVLGLGFWTVGTEEVLAMVEWVRAYNLDPGHAAQVRIFGMDPETQASSGSMRDSEMAGHVLRILDRDPSGARLMVWAHNSHVSCEPEGRVVPMGAHLRNRLGGDLVAIGFTFASGNCNVFEGPGGFRDVQVGPGRPGSLEHGLARCGLREFALDLRGPVPDWFRTRRPGWSVGAMAGWGPPIVPVVPARSYDLVVYQERITPSRLLR